MRRLREAVVHAGSLLREWVSRRHCELHFISAEEEGQHTGDGASDVVGPGGVFGIVWVVDEWRPIGVTDRIWVAVVVGFLNSGVRPPENIVALRVPGGDDCITHRQTGQR